MKIQLVEIAHARSGDKGDTANVGLIALKEEHYPLLVEKVTAEAVKEHFGEMVKGEVERFELPNLHALNFLLHESLGGGGTTMPHLCPPPRSVRPGPSARRAVLRRREPATATHYPV